MTIKYIIASIDLRLGGPSRSVTDLIKEIALSRLKGSFTIITNKSKKPIIRDFNLPNCKIWFQEIGFLRRFKNPQKAFLVQNNKKEVLFHGQGIWNLPVTQMAKYARKHNIPYLISPRGMLEPWSLQQSKLKKKLAFWLYQKEDLNNARCIHVTAKSEAESVRKLGFKNPIAIIPNGVAIANYPLKKFEKRVPRKEILFLSRIHPKKGIDILINAFYELPYELRDRWVVKIVGNGEADYLENLKRLIGSKGLENQIKLYAPIYDLDKKVQQYWSADIFVLPTFSENFGVVIAEALACGTPVITTKGTPWEDLEKYECGWWIDLSVEQLKKSLHEAMTCSPLKIEQMGKNGRKLIEENYSITSVANKMLNLYDWILYNKKQPEFVEIY